MLLCASCDVEINLGPAPSYPCTVCSLSVKDSDRGILCDKCEDWTHADCCHVNKDTYNHLTSLGDSQEWLCRRCILYTFSFTNSSHLHTSIDNTLTEDSHSINISQIARVIPEVTSTCTCILESKGILYVNFTDLFYHYFE